MYVDKVEELYGTGRRLEIQSRKMESEESTGSTKTISNPTVCLNVNEGITFAVSTTSYPVYMKDSLVNSNLNFDSSPFLELERKLLNGNSNISTFIFTFTESGTYHF